MNDVSHELGSLRYVVDSPLSSKVAMFNNQAQQHQNSQLRNPFSTPTGRVSPKPSFTKDEYGKPLAGSLTEMRGQKANMHVLREMVELCQIIDSEGYKVSDEPNMRVIPFGELFNIYNFISDKVVGILLRARKHKLVSFEGEMLFQRRDDDVPIFLLKPIQDIRHELEAKIDEIKRASSPAPLATSVLMDKTGLKSTGSARNSISPSPSPSVSKASSPARDISTPPEQPKVEKVKTQTAAKPTPEIVIINENAEQVNAETIVTPTAVEIKTASETVSQAATITAKESQEVANAVDVALTANAIKPSENMEILTNSQAEAVTVKESQEVANTVDAVPTTQPSENVEIPTELKSVSQAIINMDSTKVDPPNADVQSQVQSACDSSIGNTISSENIQSNSNNEMATVVIEATAVYVRKADAPATTETTTTTEPSAEIN